MNLVERSFDDLRLAMARHEVSTRSLADGYFSRIDTYDPTSSIRRG